MTNDSMPTTRIEPVDKTHGVLALGCWAFGGEGWGKQDDRDSLDAMREALECGMNHFDTAEAYGHGKSEQLVGRAIRDRREEVFLATKGMPHEATAEEMQNKLDESLRRLETATMSLRAQCHLFDHPIQPIESASLRRPHR